MDDLVVYMAAGIILGGRIGYVLFYNLPFYLGASRSRCSRCGTAACRSTAASLGAIVAMSGLRLAQRRLGAQRHRRGLGHRADRHRLRAAREFHQARAVGPRHRRALGDDLSRLRRSAPPPEPALRGRPRRASCSSASSCSIVARVGLRRDGLVTACFLIGYGLARIICEFFREPDKQLGFLWHGATMGQLLSVPLILAGLALLVRALRRPPAPRMRCRPPGPRRRRLERSRARAARDDRRRGAAVDRALHAALPAASRRTATTRRARRSAAPAISSPRLRSTRCSASCSGSGPRRSGATAVRQRRVRLVELGPGRGTLMTDALRATRIVPGFHEALRVDMVETSPRLEAAQRAALAGVVPSGRLASHDRGGASRTGADPRQRVLRCAARCAITCAGRSGWHERVVGLDANDKLAFGAKREPVERMAMSGRARPGARGRPRRAARDGSALAGRIATQGGALLVCDYGHAASGLGETLQALARARLRRSARRSRRGRPHHPRRFRRARPHGGRRRCGQPHTGPWSRACSCSASASFRARIF